MGAVVQLRPAKTAEEAWQRYCDLVNRRKDEDRWTDLELNKQIGRAWDEWWALARDLDEPK